MTDGRALMVALRELVEAGARMRHTVARAAGLGEHEMVALQHLSRRAIGPAELARLLGVSTAASTGIVDRLAARGHVVRRAHADDRRRTEVHLTESGRAEVLAHLSPMLTALRALEQEFDDHERAVVERYLLGATRALREVGEGAGSVSPEESPRSLPSPPRPPRRPTAR
ncbi:MarR family winged helix-turn-helix transcriptional regulator [Nocardioides sp. SOB77]|uniref:MarR family winged helix-turn-helix transcriptional regulator n=1 Tax=Nocardioides oceani TaxID=3058369 RepID=A0ABT8FCN8_9ACTN|nr:MarR family winged helix-turn-helix transcriptional regulator [Nocardioides oceani]MDN4172438.1 MarR family winged helix-turn-helix transcriptional regulator [Nocardioides oceani]